VSDPPAEDRREKDRRKRARPGPSPVADFLYDSAYGGAIGGSVVALVFLIVDLVRTEALFTPSLLGSVLFLGVPPESVTGVRLDMVAYFSLVHFVAFGLLGVTISAMVQNMEELARHPGLVTLIVFLMLEVGFLIPETLFMPGVMAAIGAAWITLANLLTGIAMAYFLLRAHRRRPIGLMGLLATNPDRRIESASPARD